MPSWVITVGSLIVLLGAWEIFGRDVNPVFGSYPSAIAEAAWQLARTGKLWTALLDSLRPFFLGYGLAIVVGSEHGDFRSSAEFAGGYLQRGPAGLSPMILPNTVMNTMASVAARANRFKASRVTTGWLAKDATNVGRAVIRINARLPWTRSSASSPRHSHSSGRPPRRPSSSRPIAASGTGSSGS